MNITKYIQFLLTELKRLLSLINSLEKDKGDLLKSNSKLLLQNRQLQDELQHLKTKKTSKNSHLPPSTDIKRKNKSLRKKSGRKPGGQKGHKGHTLEASDKPDKIQEYAPLACENCGKDLTNVNKEFIGSRQTIELPKIKPVYIQHNIYQRKCSCGCCTEESFPQEASAPVSYGPSVEGLVGYLHSRQYFPYERMQEFFTDVLGLPLSTGSLYNIIQRLTKKAEPSYEWIRKQLEKADSVGSDETSAKVNGLKHWIWAWQNAYFTYIVHSDNRGFRTIEEHFKNGFPNAVLGHDRYASHFKTEALAHQVCLVHLQRDIQYINDLYHEECQWSDSFMEFIKEALQLKKRMAKENYHKPHERKYQLEKRLDRLLDITIKEKYEKAISLQKSLKKVRDSILTFLYHPEVPPDNNGSERAIRNIKVKQKVSGGFRSDKGADHFAILRSITDTAIKSGQRVLETLNNIAKLQPE